MDKPADDSQWINGTVLEIPSEKCPVVLDPLTKMNFRILIGDILSMSPSSISNGEFQFYIILFFSRTIYFRLSVYLLR